MALSRISRATVTLGASGALVLSSTVAGSALAAVPGASPVGPTAATATAESGDLAIATLAKVHVRQKHGRSVLRIRSSELKELAYPVNKRGKLGPKQKAKVRQAASRKEARALRKKIKNRNKSRVGKIAFASLFGLEGNMGKFDGTFTATSASGAAINAAFKSGRARVYFKKGRKPLLSVVNVAKPANLADARKAANAKLDAKQARTLIPATLGKGKPAYRDAQLAGRFSRMAKPAGKTGEPENKWTMQADEAEVTKVGKDQYELTVEVSPGGVMRQVDGENGSAVRFTPGDFVDNAEAAIGDKDAPLTISAIDDEGQPVTFEANLVSVEAADPAATGPARNTVKLTVDANGEVQNLNDYTQVRIYSQTYHKGNPVLVIVGDSIASGEGGRWRATPQPQGLGQDGSGDTKTCFWGSDMSCDPVNNNGKYKPDEDKVYMRDWGFKNAAAKDKYACHRSRTAPGLWLADFLADQEGVAVSGFNYACSGAKTTNVKSAANGGKKFKTQPKPQADMLADVAKAYHVDQVVMTIGANDVGFAETATECVTWLLNPFASGDAGCRGSDVGKAFTKKVKTLDQSIKPVIDDLLAAAPDARLVVTDYLSPIAEMGERIEADHRGTAASATKYNGQAGYNPDTEVVKACESKYDDPDAYGKCYSDDTYYSAIEGDGSDGDCGILAFGCTIGGQSFNALMEQSGAPWHIRGRGKGVNGFSKWGVNTFALMPAKMNIPVGGPDRVWIHREVVPSLNDAATNAVQAARASNPGRTIDRVNMKFAANGRSTGSMSNDGSLNAINGNQGGWWWGYQPGKADTVTAGSVNGFPAGPGGQTSKAGLRAGFFTSFIVAATEGLGATAGSAASGSDGDWAGAGASGGRSGKAVSDGGNSATGFPGSGQEALHPNARGQLAQGLCLALKYTKGAAKAKAGSGDYCVREPGHSLPAVSQLPSYDYLGTPIARGTAVPDKVCLVDDPNAKTCPAGVGIEDTADLLVDGIDTGGANKWTSPKQAKMVWEDWE